MNREKMLRSTPPTELAPIRAIAHRAAQHVSKAARANLNAEADDSHSNLGWDSDLQAFCSQPISGKYVSLKLSPLTLLVLNGGEEIATLRLDNKTDIEAAKWLDERLIEAGLKEASAILLPYELPAEVAVIERYDDNTNDAGFGALAAWFDVASSALSKFYDENQNIDPGPSPVRCWPHHFDIATYVSFETGDPESARGMGIGMSPGDSGYNEPYIYVNPWPHLDANALPNAVQPGHWHTQGYVGLIATATELSSCADIEDAFSNFISSAFSVARDAQKI